MFKSLVSRFRKSSAAGTFALRLGRSTREVFKDIYASNYWGSEDSRSGTGSDLVQTAEIRRQLPILIKEYGVRSMLDIPCGDWNWMKEVALGVEYIGADIVPELVARNEQFYGKGGCRFVVLDLIQERLPTVDLIFSRDVLVHLSVEDIAAALKNMKRSGSKYLLTTTFTSRETNIDIPTGHWRPLNLQQAPFLFPEPIAILNENCTEGDGSWGDKSLGLWKLADLPDIPA